MKRMAQSIGTMSMMILILTAISWAQTGPGPGDAGNQRLHYGTMWDSGTVGTVKGEIVSVDKFTPGRGGTTYGLRFTLRADRETLPVILGPAWYIEQQRLEFAPQDQVEIKGSRISIQEQPTIIAAEVKKGDKVLRLRDAKGMPLWNGPR